MNIINLSLQQWKVRTSKKTWEHVVEDTGKQTQALSFYDQIEVRLDFRAHELSTHIYWESILDILVEWFMYMYMYIWIFVAFSKAMKDYINDMYDDHVKASKRAWLLDCTIAWCVAMRWKKFVSILSSWDFSFRRNVFASWYPTGYNPLDLSQSDMKRS